MMRADVELAGGVEKRMMAACRRAGLRIQAARTWLRPQHKDRLIEVDAATSEGCCRKAVIGMSTTVSFDGRRSDHVTIATQAAVDDLDDDRWDMPVMRGREAVPLDNLTDQLLATIQEREQVAAARRRGIKGPYDFAETRWESCPPPR